MTTKHSTHRPDSGASNQPDQFAAIMRRLLITNSTVKLAADKFGDLSELPEGYEQAGLTVCEAAKTLDALYDELDAWHVHNRAPATEATPNPFAEAPFRDALEE